jgi:hypothetical protein
MVELRSRISDPLPCDCEVRGHFMCKAVLVIPVNRVVDKKRIIEKNGGLKKRRGARGRCADLKLKKE